MALAATLVGFGLLVVALITGTLWLAIACIVVCVIGGLFLLADLLGLGNALTIRRTRSSGTADSSDPAPLDGDAADEVPDSDITTEFPRVASAEPTVTLDDPDPVSHADIADARPHGTGTTFEHRHSAPVDDDDAVQGEFVEPPATAPHGRHESPGADPAPARTPRHGRPD